MNEQFKESLGKVEMSDMTKEDLADEIESASWTLREIKIFLKHCG